MADTLLLFDSRLLSGWVGVAAVVVVIVGGVVLGFVALPTEGTVGRGFCGKGTRGDTTFLAGLLGGVGLVGVGGLPLVALE